MEVRESGGRTYYLRFTDERSRSRQLKLGDARDISLSQAKQLAEKKRNQIAMGLDPNEAKATLKKIPTVSEFIHKVYLPFVEGPTLNNPCTQRIKVGTLGVWKKS